MEGGKLKIYEWLLGTAAACVLVYYIFNLGRAAGAVFYYWTH